jgi:hypothetical protein
VGSSMFLFFCCPLLLSLCFCPAGFDHTTVNTTRHRHDFCARPLTRLKIHTWYQQKQDETALGMPSTANKKERKRTNGFVLARLGTGNDKHTHKSILRDGSA